MRKGAPHGEHSTSALALEVPMLEDDSRENEASVPTAGVLHCRGVMMVKDLADAVNLEASRAKRASPRTKDTHF